jgi:hypothetical protein
MEELEKARIDEVTGDAVRSFVDMEQKDKKQDDLENKIERNRKWRKWGLWSLQTVAMASNIPAQFSQNIEMGFGQLLQLGGQGGQEQWIAQQMGQQMVETYRRYHERHSERERIAIDKLKAGKEPRKEDGNNQTSN